MPAKIRKFIKNTIKGNNPLWVFIDSLIRYNRRSNPHFMFRRSDDFLWKPDQQTLELDITTRCSLSCLNCNRSVRQAPSNEYMTFDQIGTFIQESITGNKSWKIIRLIGGEPTLHPQLFEILELIKFYKEKNKKCHIEISTNGSGTMVNEVLSALPDWIEILNSKKNSNDQIFYPYNIAPIDSDTCTDIDFKKGCWVVKYCGVSLTRYGYYPCGPGAAVDRVFGFDIGLKKLSMVNEEALRKQMNILCGYCGHFLRNFSNEVVSEESMSESLRLAYEKFRMQRPELSLY